MKAPNRYLAPFHIGKKQKRAVLDSLGNQIVIFNAGDEAYAEQYCEFLNKVDSIINIKTKINSKLFKFKLWYLKMKRLWGYL